MFATKEAYKEWCSAQSDLPLFMQEWWLEAVSEGKRWEALSLPSGALMPVLLRQRLGMRFVVMPRQTQIGGYFGHGDSASDIALALSKLRLSYYYQKYPIGQPEAPAMAAEGFQVTPLVTYRIADLHDLPAVFGRFSTNKQRQLKKASGMRVDGQFTPAAFYAYHKRCLAQQGKRISYSEDFFLRLHAACAEHEAGHIIALRDETDAITAAVFLVYDSRTCYYLIPTYDPQLGNNGAGARLVAEAIRFAAQHSQVFDFEGSMIPGVARHYSEFGSTPTTYYSVERVYNPLFRLLLWLNAKRQYPHP